jgi:hypothetical protein
MPFVVHSINEDGRNALADAIEKKHPELSWEICKKIACIMENKGMVPTVMHASFDEWMDLFGAKQGFFKAKRGPSFEELKAMALLAVEEDHKYDKQGRQFVWFVSIVFGGPFVAFFGAVIWRLLNSQ